MSSPAKSSPLRFRPKKAEGTEILRDAKYRHDDHQHTPFPSSPTMTLPTFAKSEPLPVESTASRIPVLPTSPKSKLGFGFLTRTRKKSQNAPLPPQTSAPPAPAPAPPRRSTGALDGCKRLSTHSARNDHAVLDISSPDPFASNTAGTGAALPEHHKALGAHSFGSKLARFSPLRPRRAPRESEDTVASFPASPPVPPERHQPPNHFDSVSSSSSAGPPPPATPRSLPQPTITVSSYPDVSLVEEYRDIFTYAPVKRVTSVRQPPGSAVKSLSDSEPTSSQATTTGQQRQRALSTKSAERTRDYHHHRSNAPSRLEQASRRSEDTDSCGPSSKRRTLGSIPVPSSSNANGVSGPSRSGSIRSMVSQHSLPDSPPPPIPLPPPPTSPTQLSAPSAHGGPMMPDVPRPRANTLSAGANTGPPSLPPSAIRKVASSPLDRLLKDSPVAKINLDNASKDELRSIIHVENTRLEELATYIATMVDMHSAETTALERRILLLETEAKKKEKEMKGLRWLINNEGAQSHGPSSFEPSISSRTSASTRRSRANSGSSSSRIPTSMSMIGSDSESISRGTSGFDTSTTTDSNLFYAKRKKRHPVPTHSRTGSSNAGSGMDINGPNAPYLVPSGSKRSSVASGTIPSSPSSSTSSLGLPISSAVLSSGLDAIPEGPPTPHSHGQLLGDNMSTPVVQSRRPLPVVSVSSPETSQGDGDDDDVQQSQIAASANANANTTEATASYAANLRRDRHTSIEQVLEQSVNMDSALQKLRRFNKNDASTPSAF